MLKLQDVYKRFTDLCEQKGEDVPPSFISRLSTFKEKLCESISDLYYFHQPLNRDIHERQMLLIPKKYLFELLTENNDQDDITFRNTSKDTNENYIMTIVHAALITRQCLSEHPEYNGLNFSNELARKVVPELLHLFLSVLMKGQSAIDDFFNNNGDSYDNDEEIGTDLDSDDDSDLDSDDDSDSEDENGSNAHGRVNESKYFIIEY